MVADKGSEQSSEAKSEPKASARTKKNVEDKLDDLADRFSKAMTEGVKRMEDAFQAGVKNLKDNPDLKQGKIRSFFASSSGGAVLLIVGIVWFFYAVGLLDKPIFPLLFIALGIYLMLRHRS